MQYTIIKFNYAGTSQCMPTSLLVFQVELIRYSKVTYEGHHSDKVTKCVLEVWSTTSIVSTTTGTKGHYFQANNPG